MAKRIAQCVVCGKKFETVFSKQICCQNIECRKKRKSATTKVYYRQKGITPTAKKEFISKKDGLSQINGKARANGMSYGKYVAMLELQKTLNH